MRPASRSRSWLHKWPEIKKKIWKKHILKRIVKLGFEIRKNNRRKAFVVAIRRLGNIGTKIKCTRKKE